MVYDALLNMDIKWDFVQIQALGIAIMNGKLL